MLRKVGLHAHYRVSDSDGPTPETILFGESLGLEETAPSEQDAQDLVESQSSIVQPNEPSRFAGRLSNLRRSGGELLRSLSPVNSTFRGLENVSKTSSDHPDPLGLRLVYDVPHPRGDIIFVHGLGGTAKRTWSWERDVSNFWPAWLAEEDDLSAYRIFTFGYNSNFRGPGTTLNILDFAKDLLFHMLVFCDGEARQRIGRRPLIFVAHSMGGLVVKKAFILGKHDGKYSDIISMVHGIIFLATPHRGAHYAKILNNILWTAPFGAPPKAYIEDLDTQSRSLQDINEQFRVLCGDLSLASFYETSKTSFGVKKAMIVEKESGVLGYPQETSVPLNADHHSICKFRSREDGNYMSVKNILRMWASTLSHPQQLSMTEPSFHAHRTSRTFCTLKRIQSITGIRERGDEDLRTLRSKAMSGTCQWIVYRDSFLKWAEGGMTSRSPHIYWLIGLPAMGKTFLASYIVDYLRSESRNRLCQYHFFSATHQTQRTAAYCLRSIASQLALSNEEFREKLFELTQETGMDYNFQNQSFAVIWEKIFEGILFKIKMEPLYWVFDAFDEADLSSILIHSLLKIISVTPIKIFVTSRPMRIPSTSTAYGSSIHVHLLSRDDTSGDIRAYVRNAVYETLPHGEEQVQEDIIEHVLSKAGGSFLWVRLALETLRDNWHTHEDIHKALTELPRGMEQFYVRMLENVQAQAPRVRLMAKRILTWTACCWRPLSLDELKIALEPEFYGFIRLEETVVQICGNFVTVDNSKVSLIHMTAQKFLLDGHNGSAPFIDPAQGHEHIAIVCLEHLSDDRWKKVFKFTEYSAVEPRVSALPKNRLLLAEKGHPLLGYSVCYYAYHVSKSSLGSKHLSATLDLFFTQYCLSWIEAISLSGNLRYLTRSARYLKLYAKRRSGLSKLNDVNAALCLEDPKSDDAETVKRWAIDFIRVVGKFGPNLIQVPSSVYRLIPPFCPRASMLGSTYGSQERSILVTGLRSEGWDDCLASVHIRKGEAAKVLATDAYFLTMVSSSGEVVVWHAETCEEARRIQHGEYSPIMEVDKSQTILVTGGSESYRIWEISSGKELHRLRKNSYALTMFVAFGSAASELIIGNDDCSVASFDLNSGQQIWQVSMPLSGEYLGCPLAMSISPDLTKVAVAWRGKLPLVWDISRTSSLVKCSARSSRDSLFSPLAIQWQTNSTSIFILCQDTNLIEWHILEEEQQTFEHVKPHDMLISQDGNFMLTSNHQGTISVFTFPRLSLIYQLVNENELIEGLAFSPDGQRFYDIRGPTCNVWEPDALVRPDDHDMEDQGSSIATEPVIVCDESSQTHVTALAVSAGDGFYCAGREDGTVCVHAAADGKRLRKVSAHSLHSSIIKLAWSQSDKYIVAADDSGRLLSKRVEMKDKNTFAVSPVFDIRLDEPVEQFLFDEDERLLLISTPSSDRIWNLKSKKESCCRRWHRRQGRRWIQHPFNRELLVWIDPSGVHTYTWKELSHAESDTEPPQRPSQALSVATHGKLVHWAALTNKKEYIVYLSGTGHTDTRLSSGMHIEFLSTTDLKIMHPQSLTSACMTELASLIKRLIGTYQDRIVFLDHDYWLCTWRIDAGLDEVKRHFFLPKDWLNHNTLHMATLNAQGTFFCPKHGDVAVHFYNTTHPFSYGTDDRKDPFPPTGRDIHDFSRAGLVYALRMAPTLSNQGGIIVARVHNAAVLKYGSEVALSEARNMRRVRKSINTGVPAVVDAWEVGNQDEGDGIYRGRIGLSNLA